MGLRVLAVIAVGYWGSAFLGAAQLAGAAQRGDAQEVIRRVDLPALRRSLARQIAWAYLKATGRADKMGAFGRSVAGAAATSVADPYIGELLTPENITALLGQGKIARVSLGGREMAVDRQLPGFGGLLNSNVVALVTGSYFDTLTSFVIPVQSHSGTDTEDYYVHLRFNGLLWRLSGIDLPPAMVDDMAQSILKQGKAAAPDPAATPAP